MSAVASTRFPLALKFVLKWEGGYSNDAGDPGGATMKGITHAEYDRYRREHGNPLQDVRKITDAEVEDIYRAKYWDRCGAGTLPAPLDIAVFDCAVNQGLGAASLLLKETGSVKDGHKAAAVFIGLREARYRRLAAARPTMTKFLKGWLNRTGALRTYCGL